ncbi:MAG: MurR/RpiR family transcriptional regulator, partial [Vitreimonas sp.]
AQYAANRGVPVVALTDSEVSPLARVAAAAILVTTDSPSFFHAMTPLLAVAEILAALVAGRGGNEALAALEHTEAQLSAFGVHLSRRGAGEGI